MRFRLSELARRAKLPPIGLGTLLFLAWLSGCGGKEFKADGGSSSAGSATSGNAGTASDAGEGGNAEGGSSGSANGGRGGSAGSAGKPATGCDCGAGTYCQDGTGDCISCSNFARFTFKAPQKLTSLGQAAVSERFPRVGAESPSLFYVLGDADNAKIQYAAAPVSSTGIALSATGRVESGPLFVTGFADQNLFFDRRDGDNRKLRKAKWLAPARITGDVPFDEPLNAPGFDDYSIAISPGTGHVYWMSTRNGEAELIWQATSLEAPPDPEVLDLKVKAGKSECPRTGDDATPWVNVAGTLLLFRNPSVAEGCAENDSGAFDLFAVSLDADGRAKGTAVPLTSLNNTGGSASETDPSLSSDACTIYFASNSETGDYDLYKAQRN